MQYAERYCTPRREAAPIGPAQNADRPKPTTVETGPGGIVKKVPRDKTKLLKQKIGPRAHSRTLLQQPKAMEVVSTLKEHFDVNTG